MPTTERRSDLARRRRCQRIYNWLNDSEKWVALMAKIMKGVAIIVAAASAIVTALHLFGETPAWVMDLLSKV